MNTSIFTVAGPVMIGPSSSHTAGAAKLGRVARQICDHKFDRVEFFLHGSFALTGKGHGTDKALLAGVMGIKEDDARLPESFEIAEKEGLGFSFGEITLENAHENSVRINFYDGDELIVSVEGASIGGGEIVITKIDGYDVKIRGNLTTIFVRQNDKKQNDKKGVISHVAGLLNEYDINIATMNVSRSAKDADAMCIVEVDGDIDEELAAKLADYKEIKFVKVIKHL